jgi:hypothetical protein
MKILDLLFLAESNSLNENSQRITRQFRRTGSKLKMQYRCNYGSKQGRLVADPSKCGIRKNPRRVKAGVQSSRIKKLQRVRKSQFTKRHTPTKRINRLNQRLRVYQP